MVQDVIDSLLEELGVALQIEDLRLDEVNTCLIKFENEVEVYIEPYEKGEFLLISTDIGDVPAGRYREDVFREALKANGLPFPRYGTFAFSDQAQRLILYSLLSLRELNGEKIATFVMPFIEKAQKWKTAISQGDIPLADTMTTSQHLGPAGIFGLRP